MMSLLFLMIFFLRSRKTVMIYSNVGGGKKTVGTKDFSKVWGCNGVGSGVVYIINDISGIQNGDYFFYGGFNGCEKMIASASDDSVCYIKGTEWFYWTGTQEEHIKSDVQWVSASAGKLGCAVGTDFNLYILWQWGTIPYQVSWTNDIIQCQSTDDYAATVVMKQDHFLYYYLGNADYRLLTDTLKLKYFSHCQKSDNQRWIVGIGYDDNELYVYRFKPEMSVEWIKIPVGGAIPTVFNGFSVSKDCTVVGLDQNVFTVESGYNTIVANLFTWSCGGIDSSEANSCSSHGVCVEEDVCECYEGYVNKNNISCLFYPAEDRIQKLSVVFNDGNANQENYVDLNAWSGQARPGPRETFGMTPHPSSNDSFLIVGGSGTVYYTCYADVWEYSISRKMWKYRFGGKNQNSFVQNGEDYDPLNSPGCRQIHMIFSSNFEDLIYIHGGMSQLGFTRGFNDVWVFNLTSNQWKRKLEEGSIDYGTTGNYSSNVRPNNFGSHIQSREVSSDNTTTFFGGYDYTTNQHYSDVWQYSLSKNQFRHVHGPRVAEQAEGVGKKGVFSGSYRPAPRSNHLEWFWENILYIYGGNSAVPMDQKVWVFNTTIRQWAWISGLGGPNSASQDIWYVSGDFDYHELNIPPRSDSKSNFWRMGEYLYYLNPPVGVFVYSIVLNQWKMDYRANINNISTLCSDYNSSYPVLGERTSFSGIPLGNKVYIFGGRANNLCNASYYLREDLWSYDGVDCFRVSKYSSSVCSNNGECLETDHCSCGLKNLSSYGGVTDKCEWTCSGIPQSSQSDVCGGKGNCIYGGYCDCFTNYTGDSCQVFSCFGALNNDSSGCSGNGNCTSYDACNCDNLFYGKKCEIGSCFGIIANETDKVCSGHGNCSYFNHNCSCEEDYSGNDCYNFTCYNISNWNLSSVCNGHGKCIDVDTCSCFNRSEYIGSECEMPICFGFLGNDTENVCSDHGVCNPETLACDCVDGNYSNYDCSSYQCFGFDYNSEAVCSTHGTCLEYNKCKCTSTEYDGEKCSSWTCFNRTIGDGMICGGHGTCSNVDICNCNSGYFSAVTDEPCSFWFCGNNDLNSEEGCNNRGKCIGSNLCECRGSYHGDLCNSWSCGIASKDLPQTCNGHGKCTSPQTCSCSFGYSGSVCSTSLWIPTILAPTATLGGLIFLILFCSILCFIIFVCFCLVSLFILAMCCLSGVIGFQKLRMKKFEQLKNINILLQEQKLEEDTSQAHFKINKAMFEIPYDELKIESILGEGGSQSVVYLCRWRKLKCAFKCFKTRTIMGNQESFNEFEKEVNILASVSHPNIIRFFGATLNPPRVGIVMEFCSNGDVDYFLMKYQQTHDNIKYPFPEKVRMMLEMSQSMEYLHSRNIIHRDFKLENVLVDSNETCKLMDFGLSKHVERMSKQKTKRIGTNFYMSPEITIGENYNEKCDVFSYAIGLWMLIMEKEPYEDRYQHNIEILVANDPSFRPKIPSSTPKWLNSLMINSWKSESKDRPSFQEISLIIEENLENNKFGDLLLQVKDDDFMSKESDGDVIKEEKEEETVDDEKYKEFIEKIDLLEKRVEELEIENKELKLQNQKI